MFITFFFTRAVISFFGPVDPIVLSPGLIAAIISGTMTHIFLVPIGFMYYDSLKNKSF